MSTPTNPLTLVEWRRAVAALYAAVRAAPFNEQVRSAYEFRAARDALFTTHPASPIAPERRSQFTGLAYYPFDPAWRMLGTMERTVAEETAEVDLPAEGVLRYTRVGRIRFALHGQSAVLSIFWIEGYGGGLFVPFRDATNGETTYNGGRYLYDTIKGADLGIDGDRIVLDFNYAYNPSCAYDESWVCPLAPVENTLSFAVEAGEKLYATDIRTR